MSQIEFHDPVRTMKGKLTKDSGFIMRKKTFRSPTGIVLKEGVQESYKIVNPRDYKDKPMKGGELANINLFTESKSQTTEIIRAGKLTDAELAIMTPEERTRVAELRQQLEDFRARFYAQFKHPDSEAPFEKKPKPGANKVERKQYAKLDNFIQAILRERIRQSN